MLNLAEDRRPDDRRGASGEGDSDRIPEALRAALEEAISGRGRIVLLGKQQESRGADALAPVAEYAEQRGTRVVRISCRGGTPLLDAWSSLAEGTPTESSSGVGRLVALAHALGGARPGDPVVVLLDDLHLADKASIIVLELLALTMPGWPLAIVAAYDATAPGDHLTAVLPELMRVPHSTDVLDWDDGRVFAARMSGASPCGFYREADYWTIQFAGRVARIRDSLGLRYLAELLRHPDVRMHVTDMVVAGQGFEGRQAAGVVSERARVGVTKAIAAAIRRIGEEIPELGRHLSATIRRGYHCVYTPDPRHPIRWRV